MIIRSVEFVTSAARLDQCPTPAFPEIAFAGRSNVGKSSLINRLLQRRRLAHTSGQPGKTRLLNFFSVNGAVYFVDLPGYGYAKVGKQVQAGWGPLIERYLEHRPTLALVVHLVDLRHVPSREDRLMQRMLVDLGRPALIVCTKADKLSRSGVARQLRMIAQELDLRGRPIVAVSAAAGTGMDELWSHLDAAAAASPAAQPAAD